MLFDEQPTHIAAIEKKKNKREGRQIHEVNGAILNNRQLSLSFRIAQQVRQEPAAFMFRCLAIQIKIIVAAAVPPLIHE